MNLDNLSDFIGQPVIKVNKLFRDNGWVFYNSFNDYKFVWINKSIKESVVLCTDFDFSSDDMNECEVVVDVVHFDGIFSEILRYLVKWQSHRFVKGCLRPPIII